MSTNVQRYRLLEFYIHGSVRRNSVLMKSNKMQQCADIYLLLNHSACFGRPSRPSSGIHKTVIAASGMDHTIWRPNKDWFGHVGRSLVPR